MQLSQPSKAPGPLQAHALSDFGGHIVKIVLIAFQHDHFCQPGGVRADPPIVTAQLENLVDERTVFALQLVREGTRGPLVRTGFDVDAQHTVRVGSAPAIPRWSAVSDTARPRPAIPGPEGQILITSAKSGSK